MLQYFIKSRLGSFYLRRKYRFLSCERGKQNLRVDNPLQKSIITGQCGICLSHQSDEIAIIQSYRWERSRSIRIHPSPLFHVPCIFFR